MLDLVLAGAVGHRQPMICSNLCQGPAGPWQPHSMGTEMWRWHKAPLNSTLPVPALYVYQTLCMGYTWLVGREINHPKEFIKPDFMTLFHVGLSCIPLLMVCTQVSLYPTHRSFMPGTHLASSANHSRILQVSRILEGLRHSEILRDCLCHSLDTDFVTTDSSLVFMAAFLQNFLSQGSCG